MVDNNEKMPLGDVYASLSYLFHEVPNELATILAEKIGIGIEKTTDILGISPENPQFDLSSQDVTAGMFSYMIHERGKTHEEIYAIANEIFIEEDGVSLDEYTKNHPRYREGQKTDDMKRDSVEMIRLPIEWSMVKPPIKGNNPELN